MTGIDSQHAGDAVLPEDQAVDTDNEPGQPGDPVDADDAQEVAVDAFLASDEDDTPAGQETDPGE